MPREEPGSRIIIGRTTEYGTQEILYHHPYFIRIDKLLAFQNIRQHSIRCRSLTSTITTANDVELFFRIHIHAFI